ncbi:lipopolysaccharide kinase InaA family protein [Pseudomonas sp. KSR10]|jgi:hypothetical protein|uniref:Lipopolysaccharide kinase n=1 Tax=Stutzerimonas stutzeri TaxID=316 RepID=A0A0D9AJ12_STUST|nr:MULTISPECIES: lipopolysaccharide kinase InaA family protein [Pseudomonadaceae]KJH79361.1 lipopolysaccharide kinase [Stutzerimonas stutzeri]MCG6540960.1 lipopolysaccharide kinase InaA family protein [Pseudomonas sp. KSR10]
MIEFISPEDAGALRRAGLDSFDALWALELDAVDAPNTARDGWSSVSRLDIGGVGYYLKRQSNYLSRSLRHPLGEPSFAAEFRNIRRYQRKQVPTLSAAFFAQRRVQGTFRAVLLTRALDDWQDLSYLLAQWGRLGTMLQRAALIACGRLARQLHEARETHGSFYPKHIFLRKSSGGYEACLIDLEKTRTLFTDRGRIRDLEALIRRVGFWNEDELRCLLAAYLGEEEGNSHAVDLWLSRVQTRRQHKDAQA